MPAHDKPRISPDQIERALDLQAKGYTYPRIAAALGVSRVSVARHLAKINKRATERLLRRLAAEKGRQLSILDHTIEQSLEQWSRSIGDATTTRTTADGAGIVAEVVTTVKSQTGDPRLLGEAIRALAERRKILGIDRPAADASDDPLIVAEMMAARYNPDDEAADGPANVAARRRDEWAERQSSIG